MADITALKRMALNWLSRRDYSEAELAARLSRQGGDISDIAQVIHWCKSENYLSQQRYIEMIVRSKANRGYGLNFILQLCRQQQIQAQQVRDCADALQLDWFDLAKTHYIKKYGDSAISDYKERLKRMAYMQRRGFSQEQIQFAMSTTE